MGTQHKTTNTFTGHGETLLIIDQDYLMRELLSDILTLNGYNVILALNPKHAEMIYCKHREKIDLILSDLNYAGLGSLIARVTVQNSTPMLIFTDKKLMRKNPPTFIGFTLLEKPFDVLELFNSIRKSLNNKKHICSSTSSNQYAC